MKSKISIYIKNLQNNKLATMNFLILLFSIFWLKEINYLFYDINDSPDINKYIIYFDHFFSNEITNKEHGLMYYYLHSFNYSFFYSDFNNFNLFIHKSVLQVNFYIFIFGIVGYYHLLKFFNFSLNVIFPTLIFLNFFPPSISMRLVYKPEILAFALLPWIIYLLEKYLKNKKLFYLILLIPILVSTLTIKGNVLVIVSIYIFFSYFKVLISTSKKQFFIISIISLISFFALSYENNLSNGKSILDIQSGATIEEAYNFKAPFSIVYKADMYNLLTSPIKHEHASSFIGITLLETTGDYFDLYWDNDATDYFKGRKEIFTFVQSNEIKGPEFDESISKFIIYQQRMTDVYLNQTIGIIISIFLFYFLIVNIVKNKKYRKLLLAVIFGMLIILFHSISGIPNNNFDPSVGDTFKPLYYSFVFTLSFTILIAILLSEKYKRIFYLGIYCFLIVFILGFPKNQEFSPSTQMIEKIQSSAYCSVEKIIYLDNQDIDFIDCGINNFTNNDTVNDFYKSDFYHKPVNLLFILLTITSVIFLIFENKLSKNRFFAFIFKK
tara:strand:- start:2760 stop:4418 length:1659 start_codon:yes stop_codon:yes gene_type:complete